MDSRNKNQYLPDYLVTPMDVVGDWLDTIGMSRTEFAALVETCPNQNVAFAQILGRPAHFGEAMNLQFESDLARLSSEVPE